MYHTWSGNQDQPRLAPDWWPHYKSGAKFLDLYLGPATIGGLKNG